MNHAPHATATMPGPTHGPLHMQQRQAQAPGKHPGACAEAIGIQQGKCPKAPVRTRRISASCARHRSEERW